MEMPDMSVSILCLTCDWTNSKIFLVTFQGVGFKFLCITFNSTQFWQSKQLKILNIIVKWCNCRLFHAFGPHSSVITVDAGQNEQHQAEKKQTSVSSELTAACRCESALWRSQMSAGWMQTKYKVA